MNNLSSLASEYENWRKTKKKRCDRIPEELLSRTREAAREFGFSAVQRATKVTPSQLEKLRQGKGKPAARPVKARSQKTEFSCTIVDLPMPKSSCIELLLPGGIVVRSHDVAVCLQIVDSLTHKAREGRL